MENILIDPIAVKAKAVARLRRNAVKASKRGDIQSIIRFTEAADFLAAELCRDAITRMETYQQENHLWNILEMISEIVPTMARVLVEKGHEDLARQIGQVYDIELEQVA